MYRIQYTFEDGTIASATGPAAYIALNVWKNVALHRYAIDNTKSDYFIKGTKVSKQQFINKAREGLEALNINCFEVYNRYKHLDPVLSTLGEEDDNITQAAGKFWKAIKADLGVSDGGEQ